MYRYDEFDSKLVNERVEQFRRQTVRRLSGELNEDQFKPLRLMNGLYLQLHAYMLRINVPYGMLASKQMRQLAHIARTYDKNYGHFTTRQNIQYNWIQLKDVPDALADLAAVEMHGIQSSGIASAIPHPTNMQASLQMKFQTHVFTAKLFANGRPCIRSFRICRASSRSR